MKWLAHKLSLIIHTDMVLLTSGLMFHERNLVAETDAHLNSCHVLIEMA